MAELIPVLVPLVNPNESESLLARLCVKEGQQIKVGELVAVFETTKATLEMTADRSGFVVGITANEGDLLKNGERLFFLAERPDQKLPAELINISKNREPKSSETPSNLRITQPALALARASGIELTTLPSGQLITEKMVRAKIVESGVEVDPTALIIYGGGGHAKSLIDLIRVEGKYNVVGILDDGLPAGSAILDVPVLGSGDLLAELRQKGIAKAVNAVGGIGNITPRLKVYDKLKTAGYTFPTVIHPRAFVEPTANLGDGGQLFFNAYIGSDVKMGFGCIVNTGAIVSHDCVLNDFVNISPGAILAGAVTIKERTLIGMGVTINLNVVIGAGARVGNSAVVKADVPENGVVRAGSVWPAD